jgi:hypothetical protein
LHVRRLAYGRITCRASRAARFARARRGGAGRARRIRASRASRRQDGGWGVITRRASAGRRQVRRLHDRSLQRCVSRHIRRRARDIRRRRIRSCVADRRRKAGCVRRSVRRRVSWRRHCRRHTPGRHAPATHAPAIEQSRPLHDDGLRRHRLRHVRHGGRRTPDALALSRRRVTCGGQDDGQRRQLKRSIRQVGHVSVLATSSGRQSPFNPHLLCRRPSWQRLIAPYRRFGRDFSLGRFCDLGKGARPNPRLPPCWLSHAGRAGAPEDALPLEKSSPRTPAKSPVATGIRSQTNYVAETPHSVPAPALLSDSTVA